MLSGTALVIEDEFLIAFEIEQVLQQAGIGEVLSFRSVAAAEQVSERLTQCSIAVVEARMGATAVVQFTQRLAAAGVPVVVTSADHTVATLFPHAACLDKPFDSASLLAACAAAQAKSR